MVSWRRPSEPSAPAGFLSRQKPNWQCVFSDVSHLWVVNWNPCCSSQFSERWPASPEGQAMCPCGQVEPIPHAPSQSWCQHRRACASSSAAQMASSAAPGWAWSNRTHQPSPKATESKFISENAINKYPIQPDNQKAWQTRHSHWN